METKIGISLGPNGLSQDMFWEAIDCASKTINPPNTIGQWLNELSPKNVAEFGHHFASAMDQSYSYNLWGAAYLLLGGCSDDSFNDFRAELIIRGKKVFESILENPDLLADHADIQGDESIANLAAEAYEEKTGKELEINRTASPKNPLGNHFNFDNKEEMKKRYPRLSAIRK